MRLPGAKQGWLVLLLLLAPGQLAPPANDHALAIGRAALEGGVEMIVVFDPDTSDSGSDSVAFNLTIRNPATVPLPLGEGDRWTLVTSSGRRIRAKPVFRATCTGAPHLLAPHSECELLLEATPGAGATIEALEWKTARAPVQLMKLVPYEPARPASPLELRVPESVLLDASFPARPILLAWMRLDESGKVREVTVTQAPPGAAGQILREELTKALLPRSYEPAREGGVPVPAGFVERIRLTGRMSVERVYRPEGDLRPPLEAFIQGQFEPERVQISDPEMKATVIVPVDLGGPAEVAYAVRLDEDADPSRKRLRLDTDARRWTDGSRCSCAGQLPPASWASRFLTRWEAAAAIEPVESSVFLEIDPEGPGDMSAGAANRQPGVKIQPPELIHKTQPNYPVSARKNGIEGKVVLEAVITTSGDISDVVVIRSVPELDEGAVSAICCWKYRPALDGAGNPVKVYFTITIDFSIR